MTKFSSNPFYHEHEGWKEDEKYAPLCTSWTHRSNPCSCCRECRPWRTCLGCRREACSTQRKTWGHTKKVTGVLRQYAVTIYSNILFLNYYAILKLMKNWCNTCYCKLSTAEGFIIKCKLLMLFVKSITHMHGLFSPGSLQQSSQDLVIGSPGCLSHWQDSRPYARQMEPLHSPL